LKNLQTTCSVLLPCASAETCCQKLPLGFYSASCCLCFIAVSASFPFFSVLILLPLLQAHPRPKPSKAFFLKGIIFSFVSGAVLCIFLLGAPSSASCYRESVRVLATTFRAGQRLPCHGGQCLTQPTAVGPEKQQPLNFRREENKSKAFETFILYIFSYCICRPFFLTKSRVMKYRSVCSLCNVGKPERVSSASFIQLLQGAGKRRILPTTSRTRA